MRRITKKVCSWGVTHIVAGLIGLSFFYWLMYLPFSLLANYP